MTGVIAAPPAGMTGIASSIRAGTIGSASSICWRDWMLELLDLLQRLDGKAARSLFECLAV